MYYSGMKMIQKLDINLFLINYADTVGQIKEFVSFFVAANQFHCFIRPLN